MSRRRVRATIIGAGSAGTQVIKGLAARGVEIVGAVELLYLGEDVGEHAGIGPLGVVFEKDAEAVVARAHADVAVIATETPVAAIFDLVKLNLEHQTNVVTISEDSFYPVGEGDKALIAQLGEIAVRNGVTFMATGMQDLFWQDCLVLFSSAVREVRTLRLMTTAILDGSSEEVHREIYAGKTVEEFQSSRAADLYAGEVARGPLYAAAADLALTVISERNVMEPIVAKQDHYSKASDLHVAKGRILGTRVTTTVETAEGIDLVLEFCAKLAEEGEADNSALVVEGEPSLKVQVSRMSGFENTASIVVNRVPDVIAAQPGYVQVKDLPRLAYKPAGRFEVEDRA